MDMMEIRHRVLLNPQKGGGLPAEYQEVEAIISSDGAYFDLPKISFSTGDTIKIDVKFQYLGTKTNNFWLAGDGRSRGGVQYELGYYGQWWGTQHGAVYTTTGTHPNEIVEGTWEHEYTSGSDITYRMFQRYGGWAAETDGRKFFYFTLSLNGIVRHNLVPCYRKADNVVGMYDTVTNTFFINKGSGTFSIPT